MKIIGQALTPFQVVMLLDLGFGHEQVAGKIITDNTANGKNQEDDLVVQRKYETVDDLGNAQGRDQCGQA